MGIIDPADLSVPIFPEPVTSDGNNLGAFLAAQKAVEEGTDAETVCVIFTRLTGELCDPRWFDPSASAPNLTNAESASCDSGSRIINALNECPGYEDVGEDILERTNRQMERMELEWRLDDLERRQSN